MVIDDTQLRKLQLIELKILLELKRICEKHEIDYFLMGGTLLGAVRHKGFIPWDDDIDVGMLRSEYNKFLDICRNELSEEFFLQTYDTDCKYGHTFAKIRLNGTEFPDSAYNNELSHSGIYIDIFPFDRISDNRYIRKFHVFNLIELTAACRVKFGYNYDYSKLNQILLWQLFCTLSKDRLMKLTDYMFRLFNNKKPKYYVNGSLRCYPSEIFDEYVELEFEGIRFPAPSGYERYLECAYGDYMCLPPPNKRITHATHVPNFGIYAEIDSVENLIAQTNTLQKPCDDICKQ